MTELQVLTTFHRVEVALWLDVRQLLEQIILATINNSAPHLQKDDAGKILDFINQMELAYMHPNSSGTRVQLRYSAGALVRQAFTLRSAQAKGG